MIFLKNKYFADGESVHGIVPLATGQQLLAHDFVPNHLMNALGFLVGKTIFGRILDVLELNLAKSDQKSPLGIQNRRLKTLGQILKSGSQNPMSKFEIGT